MSKEERNKTDAEIFAAPKRNMLVLTIGINDTDNCAVLPRFLTTQIASMPNASAHQHIHTPKYYTNVYLVLLDIPTYTEAEVRNALRSIRSELIAGTFPY